MEALERKKRQQRGEAIEQVNKVIDGLKKLVLVIIDSPLDSSPWEIYVKEKLHWMELDIGWMDEAIKLRTPISKKGDRK